MKFAALCLLCLWSSPIAAQWINYPTPGVPKGRDGRPDLTAPAPRIGGKPDLSGVWQTRIVPGAEPTTEPVAGSSSFPPEFTDIAARLKGGLPYQDWSRKLWQSRQGQPSSRQSGGQVRSGRHPAASDEHPSEAIRPVVRPARDSV